MGYTPSEGLCLSLGLRAWWDNDEDIEFVPGNVRLVDGEGRVIRRYEPDAWLVALASRRHNEMLLAGLVGSLEMSSSLIPHLVGGGSLGLSSMRQLEPERLESRLSQAAAAHEQGMIEETRSILWDKTLGPGEDCYGDVHFGNTAPDWLLLTVKVGGDSHRFLFRKSTELPCDILPESLR